MHPLRRLVCFGPAAVLTVALLPAAVVAQTTVFLDAGFGLPFVAGLDGEPLAPGNRVSLGTFDPDFDFAAHAGDVTALGAAWREFGATVSRTIFGQPGRFAAALTADEPGFAGARLYLWISQTLGAAPVAPGGANITAFGLFTSGDPAWVLPTAGSLATTVTTAQVDEALWGFRNDASLQLAAPAAIIPEPSTWAAALGAVALLLGAVGRARLLP